jgi:hypothetical protein
VPNFFLRIEETAISLFGIVRQNGRGLKKIVCLVVVLIMRLDNIKGTGEGLLRASQRKTGILFLHLQRNHQWITSISDNSPQLIMHCTIEEAQWGVWTTLCSALGCFSGYLAHSFTEINSVIEGSFRGELAVIREWWIPNSLGVVICLFSSY